jgi:regulatory protein
MIIKSISKDKKGKYQIDFGDEKVSTYDDVILNNNLLYKREINNHEMEQIMKETEYYDSYQKIIKFCLTKVRSKFEVEEFIKKINFENQKEKVFSDLSKIGLINDLYFAKTYVNDKFRLYSYGPDYIRETLKMHDIDEEIIDTALNEISQEEINIKLEKMIEKKIRFSKNDSKVKLQLKLVYELTNRGFSKDHILETFENLYEENDTALNKAYEKISKKYPNENMIMKKLAVKGFSYEEIITFLNKKNKNF